MRNGLQRYIYPHMKIRIFPMGILLFLSVILQKVQAQADSVSVVNIPGDAAQLSGLQKFCEGHGLDLSTAQRLDLYKEVYSWYRTCYRYGGSGSKGIDCSGFVNMLYEKIYGVKVPRASYLIYEVCDPLSKKEERQEGDFVFFKIRKGRISHVGVYLQNNKFAHATTQAGVIISDLDEPYYKKYYYKTGRLKVVTLPEAPKQ